GQPVPAHGVKLVGGDARVGEGQQLEQGFHPARVQLFQAGGMAQLGGAVQREDQLGVDGCSVHSVPSLSNTATRSRSGMKSGESGSVTAATNSMIDCLAVVSRQLGSSSALTGRLLRLMLTWA